MTLVAVREPRRWALSATAAPERRGLAVGSGRGEGWENSPGHTATQLPTNRTVPEDKAPSEKSLTETHRDTAAARSAFPEGYAFLRLDSRRHRELGRSMHTIMAILPMAAISQVDGVAIGGVP